MSAPQTNAALQLADDYPLETIGMFCEDCGNVYCIKWLKKGDQYNDFGQRICPFCGVTTREW
jgi:hypothetical protein